MDSAHDNFIKVPLIMNSATIFLLLLGKQNSSSALHCMKRYRAKSRSIYQGVYQSAKDLISLALLSA